MTSLICDSCEMTLSICDSCEMTRLICDSCEMTRLICDSCEMTRLICDSCGSMYNCLGRSFPKIHFTCCWDVEQPSNDKQQLLTHLTTDTVMALCLQGVTPDPHTSCGPYKPGARYSERQKASEAVGRDNHDTIGMVVVDEQSRVVSGTSTNGMNHKIPG